MSVKSPLLQDDATKKLSANSSSDSSSSDGDDPSKGKPWKIDVKRESDESDALTKDGQDGKSEGKKTVSFMELFRFATPLDTFLMIVGSIFAAANGAAMPMFAVIFGSLIDEFSDPTQVDFESLVDTLVIYFVILAFAVLVASTISYGAWIYTSERQTKRLREEYLGSALRQNIGWYDKKTASAISARLSSDAALFMAGTGDKVSSMVQHLSTFFSGIIIGFVYGYQMALVVLGIVPLLAIPMGLLASLMQNLTKKAQDIYENAGAVASDAISSIRTVTAFDGQEAESRSYNNHLVDALKAGVQKSSFHGLMLGVLMMVMFSAYGVALWFGAWLIRNDITSPRTGEVYTGGDVIVVFFVVLIGAMSVGSAAPSVPAILDARVAAYRLFEVIDRKSAIDYKSEKGKRLKNFDGSLHLRNVSFRYPSRRDVRIFEGLNLTAEAGQRTAVVGVSGGGKSTIMGLIERFYDCDNGAVFAGKEQIDIRELNVRWWREQIGYVKQEPLLFRGSVKDNIKFGSPSSTDEEVIAAAKAADAHNFVMKLDHGYDTEVGDRGGLLSGGQKQRIAIARAVIRNPKVLLLDEATSALDSESERVVQRALDRVMEGRTTIIIAHRLSTIRNADKIVVVQEGEITESGTHDELMQRGGAYFHLVHSQQDAQDETLDTLEDGDERKQAAAIADSDAPHKFGDDVLFTESGRPKKEHKGYGSVPTYVDEDIDESMESSSLMRKVSLASVDGMQIYSNAQTGRGVRKSTVVGEDKVDSSKKDDKDKAPEDVVWDVEPVSVKRIFALIKGDWWYVLAGCFWAAIIGASLPFFAILISQMITLFSETDPAKQERESLQFALILIGIGVTQLFARPGLQYCFAIVGERMTRYLRHEVFKKMLRQEIGWFDHPDNSASVLTSRLETDAALVQALVIGQMPALSQSLAMIIFGVGIAFYYTWQIAAVLLACFPLLIFGSIAQMKMMTGTGKKGEKASRTADRVSGEATSNIRTVAAFTCEDEMLAEYSEALNEPLKLARKNALAAGMTFGFGLSAMFLIYALVFWYGSRLVSAGDITFDDMLTAMFALMMGAMSIGNATAMTPDVSKASAAKDNIFHVIDRQSAIDPANEAGARVTFERTEINFKDVHFSYPSRPDQSVLNGYSMDTTGGKTLALVGESGAGKSTIVSLLLRFYSPSAGQITIDGHDISTLNLRHLRSQIGLVEQEPSLFNRTIRENIRYGRKGATDLEIEESAKAANIHDSIMEFPHGYETLCGAGGSQLSGGQKQRVAIARAMLRSPKILLLDEATSALDSKSEHIVQAALDKLMRDRDASRATIVIAHRLSTVQKCDQIMVMDRGVEIEKGSHDELLEKDGAYANLSRAAGMKH